MSVSSSTPPVAAAPSPALAPPPGNPRFPLFDSLRGLAVLAVVVFHVTSITNATTDGLLGDVFGVLGNVGLTLFFVLSGFLLYRPFAAARARGAAMPSVARYARRRLLRIVPAYWAALTILAVYPGITGVFSSSWWRFYLFLSLYSVHTVGAGIPVAWTLCVEISFYVTLPVWAYLIRRWRVPAGSQGWLQSELSCLAAVAIACVLIQLLSSRLLVSDTISDSLAGEGLWFALGMSLAVLSVADSHGLLGPRVTVAAVRHSGLCWLVAAGCLVSLAAVLRPGSVFNILLQTETRQPYARTVGGLLLTITLMLGLVGPAVFGDAEGGAPRAILRWRWLALLGLISYGVYLYHLTIAELLGESSDSAHFSSVGLGLVEHVHHLTTPLLFVLTLLVSAVVAAVSYRFLELPFLRLKER